MDARHCRRLHYGLEMDIDSVSLDRQPSEMTPVEVRRMKAMLELKLA